MGIFVGKSKKIQSIIKATVVACKAGKVPLLWGPPGIGKTAVVRSLAKMYDLPLYILIPSTMDPSDVDGLPAIGTTILPDGTTATVTENTLQHWAQELIEKGKGILFIDEASTATPAVQASLLSVLQGRRVGRHTLPDGVWLIAAANDASDAADGWELAAPMANRFMHIDFPFVLNDWLDGVAVAFGKDDLSDVEAAERAKIAAFLSSPIGSPLVNNMPKDAVSAGKAWPSPRSWDNLASSLGELAADPDDVDGDNAVRTILIKGFVGDQAANEFILWHDALSLPQYDKYIKDPKSVKWSQMKADEILIITSEVIKRLDSDTALASLEVFAAIVETGKHVDVCTGKAYHLIDAVTNAQPNLNGDLQLLGALGKTFQQYLPELAKAGIVPQL